MCVSEMVSAILLWFLAQNGSAWWECGKPYTPEQAEARAQVYAQVVYDSAQRHPAPDAEEWLLAMLMQESALDRCQIAGWAKRKLKMKRRPTEKKAIEVLEKTSNGFRVDAGPMQRIYPPYGMRRYQEKRALDLKYQVELTAAKLPQYYKTCTGNYGASRKWKVKWSRKRLTCSDLYFTLHNTGGMSVNTKYHRSVSFQRYRWQKEKKKQALRLLQSPGLTARIP